MTTKIITCKVAGVTYPDPLTGEDRQAILGKLRGNEPTRIVPEPDNKFDPNALAVHIATADGVRHVGFVPRDLAKQIAPHLEGESVMASIVEVTGGFETFEGEIANLGLLISIEIPAE